MSSTKHKELAKVIDLSERRKPQKSSAPLVDQQVEASPREKLQGKTYGVALYGTLRLGKTRPADTQDDPSAASKDVRGTWLQLDVNPEGGSGGEMVAYFSDLDDVAAYMGEVANGLELCDARVDSQAGGISLTFASVGASLVITFIISRQEHPQHDAGATIIYFAPIGRLELEKLTAPWLEDFDEERSPKAPT